jgi:hypothetical protein
MADCSELATNLTQIAMNLASQDANIKTFDDVVVAMQKIFPEIRREFLAEMFIEETTRQAKETTALQKRLYEIRREPKLEKNVRENIDTLNKYLETGEMKPQKAKRVVPLRIEQLRKTRDILRKWLQTSDPAMEKKLNEQLDELNRQMAAGEITVHRRGELHDKLQSIQDEINVLRGQIKESTTKTALQNKIDTLQKHLNEGTLPESKQRTPSGDEATQQLRSVVSDLRKQLGRSEPARRKQLEKRLLEVEEKLNSGVFETKTREPSATSEAIRDIETKIKAINDEISDNRTKKRLSDKIEELKKHLESGTLPVKTVKTKKATEPIQVLRDIRDGLKKQLSGSPQAQKERLGKSITELERRINEGDIQPKIKEKPIADKRILFLEYKRNMLRSEIRHEQAKLKPKTFKDYVGPAWDFFRLFMPTGEFSYSARQGGVYMASHPIKWGKAFAKSMQAFFSAKKLYQINKDIFNRENAPLYKRSGVVLITEGMSLSKTEEAVMNYWRYKIPIFKNFDQGATAFFNIMRADLFDIGYKTIGKNGEMTEDEAKVWANWVNVSTGRGNLGSFEPAALAMNRLFFSGRYVSSRFEVLGRIVTTPFQSIAGKNKRAYRMIAKEYARLGVGLAAIYASIITMMIALLPDEEEKTVSVERSPLSSDFMKIKVGNRRLDPLFGLQQPIVFLSRILAGKTKNQAGIVTDLTEKKFGAKKVSDIIQQFARSKLSPQLGVVYDLINREDYFGKELTATRFGQLFYPMAWGDIYDVMREDNVPVNTAFTALILLGMGSQTYGSDPEYMKKKTAVSKKDYLSASNSLIEAQDAKKWLEFTASEIPYSIWETGQGIPEKLGAFVEKRRALNQRKDSLTPAELNQLKLYNTRQTILTNLSHAMTKTQDPQRRKELENRALEILNLP